MNKNLLKIGALALGMFAFGLMFTNAQQTGEVKLTINTGTSQCRFDTDMDLQSKTAILNQSLTFTGSFTGDGLGSWICTDLEGGSGFSWSLTVASTELNGTNGGTISNTNVFITNDPAVVTGDTAACQSNEDGDEALDTAYTIMERPASSTNIGVCEIYTPNVGLRVFVPENTAPGVYTGTLTVTANNINPNPY